MSSSTNPIPHINYDGDLVIATGRSRFEESWKRKPISWAQFVLKVGNPTVTPETADEYHKMAKADQDRIKDVGGFVAGELAGGRRSAQTITSRTMFALDADFGTAALWDTFCLVHGCAALAYATHKYKPDKPRFRIVGPFKRPVNPDEYEAITRWLAAQVGIDHFDDTTYQAHRLMYWPSIPSDVPYYFQVNDAPWLDPDEILAHYGPGDAWKDQSRWPESGRTQQVRKKMAETQGDPLAKPGIVGAFCRTYSIPEAIEAFLPDVYTPAGEDRYTYTAGTSACGLVLYDDGRFAFSHHGTDPISGKLVNAFDLVRLHKFGELDAGAQPGTAVTALPSYEAMAGWVTRDPAVKETIGRERLADASEEFGAIGEDVDWLKKMDTTKKGAYLSTPKNVMLLLENDPALAGKLSEDSFAHRILVHGALPWRQPGDRGAWSDKDDSGLRNYLATAYDITGKGLIVDALNGYLLKHSKHPIRDYLDALEWDGIDRLDELYIYYFGAEDSPYVRAVTRKMFVAAVARVMRPGCKFDNMLVLIGRQGIGKSRLLARLGRQWFSDSLNTVQGKEAYEAIQGVWIVEMGELATLKKAEVESVKHFLSKQSDRFRVPYDRNTSEFPRQCVFFGSTNREDFLRDVTGNRRFWPVKLEVTHPVRKEAQEISDYDIDQVWAEAVTLWRAGEALYLDDELTEAAVREQEAHMEESDKFGLISEYLDRKLPESWKDMPTHERRQYLAGDDFSGPQEGAVERTQVCILEVWCEVFGKDPAALTPIIRNEIKDILLRMPGWKPYTGGTGKLRFGSQYGPQKCFIRRHT